MSQQEVKDPNSRASAEVLAGKGDRGAVFQMETFVFPSMQTTLSLAEMIEWSGGIPPKCHIFQPAAKC